MMAMVTGKHWAFEDFAVGQVFDLGSRTVSAEEIIAFAEEFDPQPMHLDEEAGQSSMLGGLSASGWHTCGLFMRLLCDSFLLNSTSQGSPGIDYIRWLKPLLAGDTLAAHVEILALRISAKRPGLGLVTLRSSVSNQRGEAVMELQNTGMFLLKNPGAPT